MYHTRKATNPLDKVYALLGMSSDDHGIKADYESSWKDLFRDLVNSSLSNPVSVSTWDAKEVSVSVMEADGCVLGEVSSTGEDATRDDREHVEIAGKTAPSHSDAKGEQSSHPAIQASAKAIKKGGVVEVAVIEAKGYVLGNVSSVGEDVEITWKTAPGYSDSDAKAESSSQFAFQASAKAIKKGDIVCLLEGALRPTIIRLCDGFSTIIRITGPPTGCLPEWLHSITTFPTGLLLIWDWDESRRTQSGEGYEYFMSSRGVPECLRRECQCQDHLDKAARFWNFGILLNRAGRYEEAVKRLRNAVEVYGTGAVLRSQDSPYCEHGPWREADERVLRMMDDLFIDEKGAVEAKDKSHIAPLWRAAEKGHEAVVQLLLAAGKADADAKDDGATWNGHEAVVQLLLATGRVDVNAKDKDGQTPLLWATANGHEAVVELLLATGKIDVDAKDEVGKTLLSRAAENGHKAIVKLLVATGKADIDSRDNYGRTPLSRAAGRGHKAIVKLLKPYSADIDYFEDGAEDSSVEGGTGG